MPRKKKAAPLRGPKGKFLPADVVEKIKRSGLLFASGQSSGARATRPSGYRQVGTSNIARDAKRTALPPGWRISKSGKLYFENRRNRSDRVKKDRL